MIFKFQRPIAPPNGDVLVYNRDRSVMAQIRMTPELRKFFGSSLKIYAKGKVVEGNVVVDKRVGEQPW